MTGILTQGRGARQRAITLAWQTETARQLPSCGEITFTPSVSGL